MPHKLLEEAAALCTEANRVADRHADYLVRRGTITPPATHPSIVADLSTIAGTLESADNKAKARDHSAAADLLLVAKEQCAAAADKKKTAEACALKIVEVEGLLTALPATEVALAGEVAKIQISLNAAKQEAAKLTLEGYGKAETLLGKAETECAAAKMKKSMTAKTAPTDGDLKKLMATPEGAKMLDEIILGLPEDTPIAVFQEAMKTRFNLTAVDVVQDAPKGSTDTAEAGTAADDKSLRKIYELMSKVPDTHTKENPSFQQIKRYAGNPGDATRKARDKGSFYRGSEKLVVLSCGRGDATSPTALGNRDEVPPEALAHIEPGPAPTYFSWTTLHEVGHAVDDKKGFMKKNGAGAGYGGWTAHGGDVLPAAQAAATAFKYDVDYIAKLLSDSVPNPIPDAPDSRPDWEECRLEAEEWCAAVRVGKALWKNGGEAAARALDTGGGKKVFHEAYAGTWVSYSLASRNAGVSGYQFRAPGEWFAELYAAYGTKKLKATHPAYAWLKKLFKDT